jgi:hypothetical protein
MFCVSRLEGRSVRSTERSEARKVATRSEAKGHAQVVIKKHFIKNVLFDARTGRFLIAENYGLE